MNTTYDAGLFAPPQRTHLDDLREQLEAKHIEAELKLLEATLQWDNTDYIDPDDALRDPETGKMWLEVGDNPAEASISSNIASDDDLRKIREESRKLAVTNEWAICGAENRISYVVGTGHVYTVEPKEGSKLMDQVEKEQEGDKKDGDTKEAEGAATEAIQDLQTIIDEFLKVTKWHQRQQEIQRRLDRDGEAFLRFFEQDEEGLHTLAMRFVEPGQVRTPTDLPESRRKNTRFGIETAPDDTETVITYFIDGEEVDPEEIQHRKANVDCNVRRGLPLFYPVQKNLNRAEKLLRNMGAVAAIQASIAMIRKRPNTPQTKAQELIENNADASSYHAKTGNTRYYRQYGPGTIIDAPSNTEYDFPSAGLDASKYVTVLQAELRAVASRLVMPEFMLTSDASNANYSSTMVAEGPAVKMFERLQAEMIESDLEILERVLSLAGVDDELLAEIEILATAPTLVTRDQDKEMEAISKATGGKQLMSKYTARTLLELDPDFEERKVEEENEAASPFAGMEFPQGPPQPGQEPPKPPGQEPPPNEEGEE